MGLRDLDLSDNRLSGEIPAWLGNRPRLWSLHLGGRNQLTGCITEGLRRVEEGDLDTLGLPHCASDRAVLIALYNAMEGWNWESSYNWLSDAPIDEWDGVATDDSGRVAELDLRHHGLTGEIPVELGDLTGLRVLDLSLNELIGPIPDWLGSLSNLTSLDLSWNDLSGAIPSELSGLSNPDRAGPCGQPVDRRDTGLAGQSLQPDKTGSGGERVDR